MAKLRGVLLAFVLLAVALSQPELGAEVGIRCYAERYYSCFGNVCCLETCVICEDRVTGEVKGYACTVDCFDGWV